MQDRPQLPTHQRYTISNLNIGIRWFRLHQYL